MDEWDEGGEPVKRAGHIKRAFNRVLGRTQRITNSLRFLFKKLRMSKEAYTQLSQDANLWHLISDAIHMDIVKESVDVRGKYVDELMRFEKSATYSLEIDAKKIRAAFFRTDLPVKITVKE